MINWPLIFSVAAPILLIVFGALINRYFERRPRLLTHYGHIAAFKLNDAQRTDIFTHSVVVRNAGNTAATNVVIGHNFLPNVSIYPSVPHEIRAVPDTGNELFFPKIVPQETITISYLYYPPTTFRDVNTYVKSDWGHAKIIKVILQQQPPKWLLAIMWFFVIAGISAILYLSLVGVSHVYESYKKTERGTARNTAIAVSLIC